jgi:antitoxin Phd
MNNAVWKLHEAKNRFSEVINKALEEGPQTVTRYGEEVVVILSMVEYTSLLKSQTSMLEFLRQSPIVGIELDLKRDESLPRDFDL